MATITLQPTSIGNCSFSSPIGKKELDMILHKDSSEPKISSGGKLYYQIQAWSTGYHAGGELTTYFTWPNSIPNSLIKVTGIRVKMWANREVPSYGGWTRAKCELLVNGSSVDYEDKTTTSNDSGWQMFTWDMDTTTVNSLIKNNDYNSLPTLGIYVLHSAQIDGLGPLTKYALSYLFIDQIYMEIDYEPLDTKIDRKINGSYQTGRIVYKKENGSWIRMDDSAARDYISAHQYRL